MRVIVHGVPQGDVNAKDDSFINPGIGYACLKDKKYFKELKRLLKK